MSDFLHFARQVIELVNVSKHTFVAFLFMSLRYNSTDETGKSVRVTRYSSASEFLAWSMVFATSENSFGVLYKYDRRSVEVGVKCSFRLLA